MGSGTKGRCSGRALIALMLAAAVLATGVHADASTGAGQTAAPPAKKRYAPPNIVSRKWTGDLDGMIKRRMIRVLTTYSKTNYFVDRGTQRGVVYDIFHQFGAEFSTQRREKHVRTHVYFVPVARDELIPALLEGRGDIAAANLTVTPERLEQVDFTDPVRTNVSEIVVTGPGAEPIATVEALSGKEVFIRLSSSFHESIQILNADFAAAGKPPVKIRPAPEELENEDILEMVNAGLAKITIVDDHIAEFWRRIFTNLTLHPGAKVRTGGQVAWMVRKERPRLKAEVNAFISRNLRESGRPTPVFERYLKSARWARAATSKTELSKFERVVEFFRAYGHKYDLDYLLVMAQGYQESGLNQAARSPVGAIGVMQVLPSTGQDMGVGDITQLEPNIHAGVKYLRFMMNQFYQAEPMDRLNKGLFTFASYNAGPGRIRQLRRLAAKRGLDPNVWFNHVEVVAAERIGRETVQYVSNIYKYYVAYRMIEEEQAARDKAKEDLT